MEADQFTTLTRLAWSGAQVGGTKVLLRRAAWSGLQAGGLKAVAKRNVGHKWQERAHGLNRLRWVTKYRLARDLEADIGIRRRLAYILLDPELESYSFELEDEREVIAGLAIALGRSEAELAAYAEETHSDPELNERLTRHVRWRFASKRRQPLGTRLAWYILARAMKPELIIETGIYKGLGSLALLRALERNRGDGHPGKLMSFDVSSHAGVLVRAEIREGWQRVIGLTSETLLAALAGRRVGILFQDTLHSEENQRLEFEAALEHSADELALVDCSGGHLKTLENLCDERGGSYHRVPIRPRAHVHPGGNFSFGLFAASD